MVRSYGHVSEDTLPTKLLFGKVEGAQPRVRPLYAWNRTPCNVLGGLRAATYGIERSLIGCLEAADCTHTHIAGELIQSIHRCADDDDDDDDVVQAARARQLKACDRACRCPQGC